MKIEISVKEEHIINGVCGDAENCAIHKAIKDVLPIISVFEKITFPDFQITNPAFDKAKQFDDCQWFHRNGVGILVGKERLKWIQPFKFTVDIPDDKLLQILPSNTIEEAKQIINNSESLQTVE